MIGKEGINHPVYRLNRVNIPSPTGLSGNFTKYDTIYGVMAYNHEETSDRYLAKWSKKRAPNCRSEERARAARVRRRTINKTLESETSEIERLS